MDYGSRYTDKRQKIIEIRLQKVYRAAQKQLEEDFDAFLKGHKEKGEEMWQKLQAGEITKAAYSAWMKKEVLTGKEWQRKIDDAAEKLANANEEALKIVRGEQLGVFAENANYEMFQMEKDLRGAVSFDLFDTATVERLVKDDPDLLPRKTLNRGKDEKWNRRVINNAVTQAVVSGESIPKLAERISHDTADSDMKAMTRYARTAMTSAQNAGRIETMHQAQDMGVSVKKKWLSTLDSRTRDAHRDLDGQVQEVDDPFESELGDIMFPGDPAADPGNVYNCRCTMTYVYEGFSSGGNRRAYTDDEDSRESYVTENMSYREWERRKKGE